MTTYAAPVRHADTVDIADAARSIRRGWREVLGCFVFGVALAIAIILWAPKTYKSPASILVRQSDAGSSLISKIAGQAGIGDLAGLASGASKGTLETEIAILNSRALAGQVIDSLHLQFYSRGKLLARSDAISTFLKKLSIEKVGGDVLGVEYAAKDSVNAARIPNTIIALYLARRKTTDRGVNAHRVEFLQAKLDEAEAKLAVAEDNLRREQERSGVLDPLVVSKLELEQAGDLRAQLTTVQVESGALDSLIAQVNKGTMTTRQLAAFPSFIKSPAISQMLGQLSSLDAQRLTLLATRTETDPDVEAVTQSIKAVEGQLMPTAQSYAKAVRAQKIDLEGELDSLRAVLLGMPKNAQANGRMQREVLRLGQIYAAMQAQLVEASLSAIGEGGDVHQLDFAEVALHPSFPQPLLTLGVGAIGGLVLGLFVALFMGGLGRWARDPIEIERATGLPALAFDASSPLLIAPNVSARTVLVLPLDAYARTEPVARRLAETASARAISTTVLDLSNADGTEANSAIERLESEFASVIVQLPPLTTQTAAAALRETRPVVLVASAPRVDKIALTNALGTLRRLDIPCAGIVMSSSSRNGVLHG
jgi:tyrosine-protein kinase Etk/Wzc